MPNEQKKNRSNYTKNTGNSKNPTEKSNYRGQSSATGQLSRLRAIEASILGDEKEKPKTAKTGQRTQKQPSAGRTGISRSEMTEKNQQSKQKKGKQKPKKVSQTKLRVMLLGGLQEIGKNMTVFEYGEDILIVDCGVAFPDDDMFGIDLVIPDISYLEKNRDRVRGILLTHGHEDHIGAVPYVLQQLNVPVYGTAMTMGIVRYKLEEFRLSFVPQLHVVKPSSIVQLGAFSAEFIHVNHSIADACALAIKTPVGTVFHTGDFKLDVSPIDGNIMDLVRIGEIGRKGVLLLMSESTNAERPGYTPSERSLGYSFDQIFFTNPDKRIIVATFSSNVHRVQQVIDASIKYGRKIAILGRSMINVIGAARELGYMQLPEGSLIDVQDIKRYRPDQITLITTGSQGEPMSALYRIAFGEHDKVKLTTQDLVVLSASAIPGNEKFIDNIINAMVRCGIKVVNDRYAEVHVSGHACSEELKLMLALLRPKFFMPIHGESRHLYAHKEIAEFMGITADRIFVTDIGQVLELDEENARIAGTVPSGIVMVDGTGVGDVGSVVLRDRKLLAQDGLIVVVATVSAQDSCIISGPDIISRGYVYMKESENLLDEARRIAARAISKGIAKKATDYMQMKAMVKEDLTRFFYATNKRKPMVLPVIMNV